MQAVKPESRDAYDRLRREGKLGTLQANVLRMIGKYPGRTSREYADLYFSLHPRENVLDTSVQPRISELEKQGWIYRPRRRKCTITGRTVGVFEISEEKQEELFYE